MANQTSSRVLVAIKRETTTGVAATAAGATQLRINDSPGLELKRAIIQSQEKRSDGLKSMGRLGGKSVDGSYNAELSVGGATDILLEAILRSTWVPSTALTTATGAGACVDLTANSTSQITRTGSGSFLTDGWKVGDIARLANYSTAANNDLNLRVVSVTATVLTFAGTPLTVGAADTSCSLTVLKKLTTGATPTRYSHTVEQYDADIDLSELFLGCRVVGVKLSFKPSQMATVVYTLMGMDRTQLVAGTSPWFTTPALTTSLALIADDSSIRYNGAEVANFTGFDLEFQITANGQPVIGSFVSPDIFDNDLMVSGSVSAIRQSFANLTLFDAETEFELGILLQEPGAVPKACIGFFLPRVKIQALSAPVGGGDGAKVETLPFMTAAKVAATGYDGSIVSVFSSAP